MLYANLQVNRHQDFIAKVNMNIGTFWQSQLLRCESSFHIFYMLDVIPQATGYDEVISDV